MDFKNNYKFVIIQDDVIFFLNDIKEIPLHFNTTIYETLSKTRDFDTCNMYSITDSSVNKDVKYLITKNDFSFFNIYNSIRSAGKDLEVDYSSLAKQLKNNKYRSIGGKNPGRKKKNVDKIHDGLSIFKIKYFDFGKYYPKLEMNDILIEDL